MPQLMPMFWKSSVFMSFILLMVLVLFFFFKSKEKFFMKKEVEVKMIMFEFSW